MTRARELGRLHRSFAGVESDYVRELGRRAHGRSRVVRPVAGSEYRSAGRVRKPALVSRRP
jgi:hypothetical protein